MRQRIGIFSVVFFLSILTLLLVLSALSESTVFDEPIHLKAGYETITKRDFTSNVENPPLPREIISLPLLLFPEILIQPVPYLPRLIVIGTTVLLAVFTSWFAKRLYGRRAGILTLILFTFEPSLLAHGHYATTDLLFTFFITLTIISFWCWTKRVTVTSTVFLAVSVGLALASKILALPILSLSFFILFVLMLIKKDTAFKHPHHALQHGILLITITFLTLWSTYFYSWQSHPESEVSVEPKILSLILHSVASSKNPLSSYANTILAGMHYNGLDHLRQPFYFGSVHDHALPQYYLVAFLLKTPLPLLILFTASLILLVKKRENTAIIFVPITVLFLSMIFVNVDIGIRYMLPVYPLVIIFSSRIAGLFKPSHHFPYLFIMILVLWQCLGTLQVFPYFISFFNEFAGGTQGGYHYFVDSNVDWGQGLIALKKFQETIPQTPLQLAYFGSVVPTQYGIRSEPIKNISIKDKKRPVPLDVTRTKIVAISMTCWYFCGYADNPETRYWKPDRIVGGSLLIFLPKKENT
jgi:hypothetical protein